MNKKSYLIAQIIAACCMICACGAGPDGTETASDTKLVLTGYTVENDTMTTENPDSAETNDNINFSNAALGDVQTENVRLKKSAVIYTKPDANASQLGSLDKGTKVKAIGEADANGWLMIDYNGRAGRDGEPSQCILLFSAQDIMINRLLLENKDFQNVIDRRWLPCSL